MNLFSLVVILSALILPVMADSSTLSTGTVGIPLVGASPKVGVPLPQQTSKGGALGTPQPRQSNHVANTLPTPTYTPIVGTPKPHSATTTTSVSAASSTGGVVGKPLSQSNFNQHSPALPAYAVPVIVVFTIILFLTLVAFIGWRVYEHRCLNNKPKDIEEEDAVEAYAKYWKGKRNSGGNVAKGNISPTVDEKVGGNANV